MADQSDSRACPTANAVPRPLRKACDECHAIKVKCLPRNDPCESASSICQRCHRLNFECRFSPADIKSRRRKRRKVAEAEVGNDSHSDGDADTLQAHSTHQVCTTQQVPHSQPTPNQIPSAYAPACPPFPLAFPTPPLISDFSSSEWEGWFRDLPMGNATSSSPSGQIYPCGQIGDTSLSRTTSPSTFIPQTGNESQTNFSTDPFSDRAAASSPWASAAPTLTSHTQLPTTSSTTRHADQEAMLRAIFGADPCFSFPTTSACGSLPEQNQQTIPHSDTQECQGTVASTSMTPDTSQSTRAPSFHDNSVLCPKRNASSPSSTRTNAHLSIEARLSHLSLEFSAALDRCDPSRKNINSGVDDDGNDGGNDRDAEAEAAQQETSKAEAHLLSLFAQADDVWCEMDRVGADRMKKMYDIIETLRKKDKDEAEGEGETQASPNIESPRPTHDPSKSLAVRYSKSLQGPFTSAGAMLALSLSFQMLDALRLLSSILDTANASAHSTQTLSTILTSFQFDAHPLNSTLHVPILASLRNHYLHRLIHKLDNVITYARTWHHLGEGMGPGPHDSCAVQIQGAKVKGDLLELSRRVG